MSEQMIICSNCGETISNCYCCQCGDFKHGEPIRCEKVLKQFPKWNNGEAIGGYSVHFGMNCCNPANTVKAYAFDPQLVSDILEDVLTSEKRVQAGAGHK